MADISQVKLPNGDTYNLVDETSGYIKNYTETDPIFNASVAAGITSTDINNWNAKVNKSGDTMTGNLAINATSSANKLIIGLGNGYSGLYLKQSNDISTDDENDILIRHGPATGTTTPLLCIGRGRQGTGGAVILRGVATPTNGTDAANKAYVDNAIPSIPTNISSFTNDSGYLTASDIASVMTYKGTKANYAALPASGNTTGDVWHLTDTGAEWAWDGSAWQELGTAIDLSGYVPTSRTVNDKALSSNISLTASDVGAAESSHIHGYLTNNGTFSTQSAIGNGDYLVITDKSDSYKLKHSGLAFDGSTTTKALTQKGTWETFLQSYTETDPVFSASAAAGITSTDISNWNGKSSTDEKVKQTPLNGINSYRGLLFSSGQGGSETTNTAYTSNKIQWSDNSQALVIYNSDRTKNATIKYNTLWLADSNSSYIGRLYTNTLSETRTYNFPNNSGTIALTSDIPQVYSSTNTGGYLTMATLPIYDGTVV